MLTTPGIGKGGVDNLHDGTRSQGRVLAPVQVADPPGTVRGRAVPFFLTVVACRLAGRLEARQVTHMSMVTPVVKVEDAYGSLDELVGGLERRGESELGLTRVDRVAKIDVALDEVVGGLGTCP